MDTSATLLKSQNALDQLQNFWQSRIVEKEFGGFQTNYDRDGQPTESNEKTLLCQARCIFTLSFAKRLGYGWDGIEADIQQGIDFLQTHFLDPDNGTYYWICDKQGNCLDDNKVLYGHSFLIYGFA